MSKVLNYTKKVHSHCILVRSCSKSLDVKQISKEDIFTPGSLG